MTKTESKDFRCPDFQTIERQGIVSMGYDDVFAQNLQFPREEWFWFSPRQISKYDPDVVSSLPGKRLCLRPSKSGAPKVSPSPMVFFKGKARVEISWEEKDFNTSRCGKEQAVTLVYTPKNKNNFYEKVPHNHFTLTLTDNTVDSTTFSLTMGTISPEMRTEVTAIVCTEQGDQAFNVQDDRDNTTWSVSWKNYDFGGADCYDLKLKENCAFGGADCDLKLKENSFFVLRYEAVSVESGTVIQHEEQKNVEEFSAKLDKPEDFGRRGVLATMTIELYYRPSNGLINSITLQHHFCKPQAPELSDSVIVARGDTQCEENDVEKPVQLIFPSVTEWGRTCGEEFVQQKRFYKPDETVMDWTQSMTTENLKCPDETVTYTFSFGAFNGMHETNASVAITVCRMSKPAAPTNLLMVSEDPDMVVIAEDSNVGVLKWDFTDDSWGYCMPPSTNQGTFIVGKKVDDSCRKLGQVDNSAREFSIDLGLDKQNTRKKAEYCVRAIRGSAEGPITSSSFDVCRLTRPGIPVLNPLNGEVGGEVEFTWEPSAYPGDDCKSTASQVRYKFVLVDSSGNQVYTKTDLVQPTTGLVNLNQFNGQFKWSVTAFIENTPSLSTKSAKSTVSIGPCLVAAPFPEEPESVKPAENENFSLEDFDGFNSVSFSWAAPDWGTLCGHEESDKRTMSLVVEIENNGSWKEWNKTDKFDDGITRYSVDMKVKQGSYRWTVKATISNSTSKPLTTTLIDRRPFSVCLFSLLSVAFECNESSYAVVDPKTLTVPLNFTVGGKLNTCDNTYTVSMNGRVTANGNVNNLDEVIFSTDKNGNTPVSPYVLNVPFLNGISGIVDGSFGMKSTLIATTKNTPSCEQKLCIPTSPSQLTFLLKVDESKLGTIKANWTSAADDVAASGCWAEDPVFDYILNFTRTEGNKLVETTIAEAKNTKEVSLVRDNQLSGSYTLFMRGFNGFFWSEWSSSSVSLCRRESFTAATLETPRDGSSPWYQGVHFSFKNLPVAKESCRKLVSKLEYWKKANREDRVVRELDAGETGYFAKELDPDVEYCWVVTSQAGVVTSQAGVVPVTSPEYCFTTCRDTPRDLNVTHLTPDDGVVVTKWKSENIFFAWDSQVKTGCSLDWTYTVNIATTDSMKNPIMFPTSDNKTEVARLVNGTKYYWNVVASHVQSNSVANSEKRSFTYCVGVEPEAPEVVGPLRYSQLADGIYFTVRESDPGFSCMESVTNESAAANYSVIVQRGSDEPMEFTVPYSDAEVVESNSGLVTRIAQLPSNASYGTYTWVAALTNAAGRTTQSAQESFVVCDLPGLVELTSPVTNTNTSNEIVFEWNASTVSLGYPCGQATHQENLTVVVEDADTYGRVASKPFTKSAVILGGVKSWDATEVLGDVLEFGKSYRWYVVVSNGEEVTAATPWTFTVTKMTCALLHCKEGTCATNTTDGALFCACRPGFSGARCDVEDENANRAWVPVVASVVPAFIVVAIIVVVIVLVLVRKRKREGRKRVVLKGPSGDLRFSAVKGPEGTSGAVVALGAADTERVHALLKEDAETGGFALSLAILSGTPSTQIENMCKALLYAHNHDKHGVALLKALIAHEVDACTKADVIFRANTAATLMFKHLSKMVGLEYLFGTLGKVLRDVMQKDADDAAVEEQMKSDKDLSELMVLQDAFEVDPNKLGGDSGSGGEDDVLSINTLQLALLVQRFMKCIFQSVHNMPDELRDVMTELCDVVAAKYPEAVQRALSAFLFLRFYNCGIAVPEAYGLLDAPPNERVRRSLVLVTKILTTVTSGAHFGEKEAFMAQFNDLVDTTQKPLTAFYEGVCKRDAAMVSEEDNQPSRNFVDTPPDTFARSLAVIAATPQVSSPGGAADDASHQDV